MIALASGAGAQSLSRIAVGDIADDGSEIRLGQRAVVVPTSARALARAKLIDQHDRGASPADTLLTTDPSHDAATTARTLRNMLARVSAQTGLAMPRHDAIPGGWWQMPTGPVRVHAL